MTFLRLLNNDSGLGLPPSAADNPHSRSPPTLARVVNLTQHSNRLHGTQSSSNSTSSYRRALRSLGLDLQQQEDGGMVNLNGVPLWSQTYGSSSCQQWMNEFTFGGSSNLNPNSNSISGATGGQAVSSPPTPLNRDDQNPIRGSLQIIDSLVPKI